MYSLIGGLFIFISCSVVGFSVAQMYRRRVEQLDAFLRFISHIKAQIEYYRAPLDEILVNLKNKQLSDCGFLLAARELGVKNGFNSCRQRLLLSDEECEELEKFFDSLGSHTAEEEGIHCEYYEKRISELLNLERAELAKRSKLCRTFGMLIGFLLAVLMI